MTVAHDGLLTEVKHEFASEIRTGVLRLAAHKYHSEAFGDSVVVLDGGNLRLMIKRERSEPYALIASASAPDEWERLQAAVSAITGEEIPGAIEAIGWEMQVAEAAALYRQFAHELTTAYGSWWRRRRTRKKLRELRKKQQRSMDAWLNSPKSTAETSLDEGARCAVNEPSTELKAALDTLLDDKQGRP